MRKQMVTLLSAFLLVGCGNKTSATSEKPFTPKTNYGIPPVFSDPLGIYDKDPCVLEEGGKTYLFYTTNENEFEEGDVLAMRIGEKTAEGTITYGERNIILTPSANSWDSSRISNPSVIKGVFPFEGHTYSYLLAYQGTSKVKDKLYQIGFAFSDNLTDWKRAGKEPMIKYSSYAYGSSYGLGAPSLVSYDKAGKFYCFYTYADSLITTTRVSYFSFGEGGIKTSEPSAVSSKGLEDKSGDVVFNNADMMLSSDGRTLYCVRDRNPVLSLPATSDSIQVAKADISLLTAPTEFTWELVTRSISDLDTAVLDGTEEQEFGWERIYSACFKTDAYGRKDTDRLNVYFTVSATGEGNDKDDYRYSGAIVNYEIQ